MIFGHQEKKRQKSFHDAQAKWLHVYEEVRDAAYSWADVTDPRAAALLDELRNPPGHPQDMRARVTRIKNQFGRLIGLQAAEGLASLPNPSDAPLTSGWDDQNAGVVAQYFVHDMLFVAFVEAYQTIGLAINDVAEELGFSFNDPALRISSSFMRLLGGTAHNSSAFGNSTRHRKKFATLGG